MNLFKKFAKVFGPEPIPIRTYVGKLLLVNITHDQHERFAFEITLSFILRLKEGDSLLFGYAITHKAGAVETFLKAALGLQDVIKHEHQISMTGWKDAGWAAEGQVIIVNKLEFEGKTYEF